MSKFKVGNRVAAYIAGWRYLAEVKVVDVDKLIIEVDGHGRYTVHEKQLRRLIKKSPEIHWVHASNLSGRQLNKHYVKVKVLK